MKNLMSRENRKGNEGIDIKCNQFIKVNKTSSIKKTIVIKSKENVRTVKIIANFIK